MEAHLSFHRGNKHSVNGPSGDLPWNKLGYYFGPSKQEEKKEKSLPSRVWTTLTLKFDQRKLEDSFDEAFCQQNLYRCRVVTVFMLVLFLVHFILEVSISDLPQNQFYAPSLRTKHPPLWSTTLILVMVWLYGGYMFLISRSQRYFFTRAMHVLMVSAVLEVGFALLCLTILLKDIGPPTTFIALFCGIYISPPSKLPIITSVCAILLLSLVIYFLTQASLTSHLKLTYILLLLLANFLGIVVLSQIEAIIRHEFMQIYNTKVEFRDLVKEQTQWETIIYAILPAPIVSTLRDKKQHTPVKHYDVSVLIAEVVDFDTNISAALSPEESVVFLNRIYSIFERLIDNYKLEKIRTFGPVILIAGGLNMSYETHLQSMVDLGTDMLLEIERLSKRIPLKIMLRLAITTGDVVDGVVGKTKLSYDMWGDPVTTASLLIRKKDLGSTYA